MPDSTIDIVKAIRSRTLKASERPSITDQLRHAAHAGEIDACFNVLGRGCDVNNRADGKGKWKSGNTAMHIAAGQGHSSVINLLLEFRADTTVKNMDAELPLHLAARAGHTNCVMVLLEAERSKQPHVRRMERNLERPRVRTRDLVTSGRFRLPPTFALSSQTLRAAITSTKSFIEMAHAEKNESSKKDGLAPGGKFAINNSQFLEFSVAEFGARHSRINDQQMVKAQPIHGDTDLTNPAQCEGRIVVMKRGRSRFVEKALRAQAAGALALVVINHSDDGDRAKPVIRSGRGAEEVKIPVVGVTAYDSHGIFGSCLEWPAVHDVSIDWHDIVPTNHDTVIDLAYSVVKQRRNPGENVVAVVEENLLVSHQLPTLSISRPDLVYRPQPRFKQLLTAEQSFAEDEVADQLMVATNQAAEAAATASHLLGEEVDGDMWGLDPNDDGSARDSVGPGTAGGGWTSATNHLMIPETPGKSPTLPATPMMQRMALQATGTYKKGYQPSGEAKRLLRLADKYIQEMPPRYAEAAAAIEQAQASDAIYTAKKLGLFREVIETAIESSNPGQRPVDSKPASSQSSVSSLGLSVSMPGPLDESTFEQFAPFVLDVGEATKNLSEQKPYSCPLLGTPNLWLDTALHLATRYQHTDIVQLLLAFGAPVDGRNKWAFTPLHEAARARVVPSVRLLLQYGADPLLPDQDGNSALHYCAAYADEAGVDLITMLLEAVPPPVNASVARMRNKNGYSPVHIAKAHGHGQLLRTLMDSLGPEHFFKTNAEQRYCPEVAGGAIHRRPTSVGIWADPRGPREAWRCELAELQRLKAERREREAAEQAAAAAAQAAAEAAAKAAAKEAAAREAAAKHVRPKLEPLLEGCELTWEEALPALLEQEIDAIKESMVDPEPLVKHLIAAVGKHRMQIAKLAGSFAFAVAPGMTVDHDAIAVQDGGQAGGQVQQLMQEQPELQSDLPPPGARRLKSERSRLRRRFEACQKAAAEAAAVEAAKGPGQKGVARKGLWLQRGNNEMLQSGTTTIGRPIDIAAARAGETSTSSSQRKSQRKVQLNVQTEFSG